MVCSVTTLLIVVMSGLYIAHTAGVLIWSPPTDLANSLALIPRNITGGQFTRFFTSSFIHKSPIPFVFNMIDLHTLGKGFEKEWGHSLFLANVLGIATVAALIVYGIASALNWYGYPAAYDTPFCGFGSVIMAFYILDRWVSEQRKLLRVFSVPSWIYPWILLFVRAILVQDMTFLADLAGIIVGYLRDPHRRFPATPQRVPPAEIACQPSPERVVKSSRSPSPSPIAGNEVRRRAKASATGKQ